MASGTQVPADVILRTKSLNGITAKSHKCHSRYNACFSCQCHSVSPPVLPPPLPCLPSAFLLPLAFFVVSASLGPAASSAPPPPPPSWEASPALLFSFPSWFPMFQPHCCAAAPWGYSGHLGPGEGQGSVWDNSGSWVGRWEERPRSAQLAPLTSAAALHNARWLTRLPSLRLWLRPWLAGANMLSSARTPHQWLHRTQPWPGSPPTATAPSVPPLAPPATQPEKCLNL